MEKAKLNVTTVLIINPFVRRKILRTAEEIEKALKDKKTNPKNDESH